MEKKKEFYEPQFYCEKDEVEDEKSEGYYNQDENFSLEELDDSAKE